MNTEDRPPESSFARLLLGNCVTEPCHIVNAVAATHRMIGGCFETVCQPDSCGTQSLFGGSIRFAANWLAALLYEGPHQRITGGSSLRKKPRFSGPPRTPSESRVMWTYWVSENGQVRPANPWSHLAEKLGEHEADRGQFTDGDIARLFREMP